MGSTWHFLFYIWYANWYLDLKNITENRFFGIINNLSTTKETARRSKWGHLPVFQFVCNYWTYIGISKSTKKYQLFWNCVKLELNGWVGVVYRGSSWKAPGGGFFFPEILGEASQNKIPIPLGLLANVLRNSRVFTIPALGLISSCTLSLCL